MSRIFAAAKGAALGAFLLTVTACTSPAPLRNTTYYGGVWPGWQDIDIGGFEELGRVTWHSGWLYGGAAVDKAGKSVAPLYTATAASASPGAHYEFYPERKGIRKFFPARSYVPLAISGNVANRVVLDQASVAGSLVHISGRQRSGLWPGGAYVEVTRATPVRRERPLTW